MPTRTTLLFSALITLWLCGCDEQAPVPASERAENRVAPLIDEATRATRYESLKQCIEFVDAAVEDFDQIVAQREEIGLPIATDLQIEINEACIRVQEAIIATAKRERDGLTAAPPPDLDTRVAELLQLISSLEPTEY